MRLGTTRIRRREHRIVGRIRRIARIVDRTMRRSNTYGLVPAIRLSWRDRVPAAEPIDLEPDGYSAPLRIRLGGSDLRTFDHVIIDVGYTPPFAIDPNVIVDAGANIGLSSVWFARRHPEATIIAIEPDPENFALLEHNVAPYPNIRCVRAALWSSVGEVNLVDPGIGSWGFRVGQSDDAAPTDGHGVPAIDVPALLDRFGLDRIDLFKIDIEGGERELFRDPSAWLDRVDVIAIELHDRYTPGCSSSFYRATGDFTVEGNLGETNWVARASAVRDDHPQ